MPFFNYSIVRRAGGDETMQIVFIDTFILSEGYTRNLIKQKIAFGELHPGTISMMSLCAARAFVRVYIRH